MLSGNAARDVAAELGVSLATLYTYVDAKGDFASGLLNCSPIAR
ncbi:protein of unknown function (plasmid) [Shinella sp. WSC3-e]|nr:protein of unknown function [Shinella sp. WSC3-e]